MIVIKTYLLLAIYKFVIIHCQAHLKTTSEVKVKNWCYMMKNNSGHSYERCPNIDDPIEVNFKPGSKSGIMIAEFLLAPPSCLQLGYEIELLFDKGRHDDRNCSKISSAVHHSLKKFKVFPCYNGSYTDICEKYGSVYFFNVQSGCYKAVIKQITRYNQLMQPLLCGTPYPIQKPQITNYFKRRLTNWTYINGSHTRSWDMEIDIQDPVLHSKGINISVKFSMPTSDVTIQLKSDNSTEVMNMTMLSESEKCQLLKSETGPEGIIRYDGLLCTFSYLSTEHQTFLVQVFKDEQCDYEMKNSWEAKLCWKTQVRDIHIPSHKDKVTMEIQGNWIMPVIIMCLSFLVFLLGITIWKFFRIGRKPIQVHKEGELQLLETHILNNDFEILLLYAKDCKEFMLTMKSFGQLLAELCHVKVYDCFDEPNWEDEQISPHDWIERIIKFKPYLHIVIVSTHCACIQHQMFLSGAWNANISVFKDPSYLDKIFLYGLQIVKDYEISNLAYGKIFIMQLNGFSDDTNSKELSSLSRVYQIPLHLNELVQDMKITSSVEEDLDEIDTFERSGIYINFLNHLESLRTYKKENQNYLTEILLPTMKDYRKIKI